MGNDDVRHNLKDSLFTSLFSIPKYLKELYLCLPGCDESVMEEELKTENIQNTIAYGIYNDLAFSVRGKKLILVEAQSTPSPFMPQRMNNYFCSILYKAFPDLEVEQYRSKKPENMPEVLFAVVYTGRKKVPPYYETEFLFNDGQTIKIRVVVLTKRNTSGILKAYCIFSEEYDRNRALYGRTADAVMKTIEYCNECEDTISIREYLKEKEEEIVRIMSDEERQKRLFNKIRRTERKEGEAIGRIRTLMELIKDGTISEEGAAKRADMSLEDFRKAAEAYCS